MADFYLLLIKYSDLCKMKIDNCNTSSMQHYAAYKKIFPVNGLMKIGLLIYNKKSTICFQLKVLFSKQKKALFLYITLKFRVFSFYKIVLYTNTNMKDTLNKFYNSELKILHLAHTTGIK
jgi:hypothetical protein